MIIRNLKCDDLHLIHSKCVNYVFVRMPKPCVVPVLDLMCVPHGCSHTTFWNTVLVTVLRCNVLMYRLWFKLGTSLTGAKMKSPFYPY